MNRAARLAGLVGLAAMSRAHLAPAEPTRLVSAPAGWRADPEQASALAQRFAATSHFGGLASVTAAEAHIADRPGLALFVTRATATLADPAQAARAARAALDELRASSARTSLAGGSAKERAWDERTLAGARLVTATLSWSDPESHTVETARVVVASDGTRIVAVTGECLASDAADPAGVVACQASLATLDPGVAVASRIAITPGAASQAAGDPAARPAQPGLASPAPAAPPSLVREPARLGDGSKFVLPPTTIPLDRPDADRRPMFVGAGLIVLALVFWWNRRRRDRFEREDRGEPPAARRPAPDDDADDLHAAARGDGRERPDRQDVPAAPDPKDPQDRQAP